MTYMALNTATTADASHALEAISNVNGLTREWKRDVCNNYVNTIVGKSMKTIITGSIEE